MAANKNTQQFLDTISARRTFYSLTNTSPVPDSRIEEIVAHTIKHTPTAFNTQSTRAVVLLKEEHEKLWTFTAEILQAKIGEEAFQQGTRAKLENFKGAYGTVLFLEDISHVAPLKEKFALYADKFESWTDQSNGMAQLIIWTALEAEGFGVNLQHYNPLIDAKVHETWDIPENWILKSQMVFGTPTAQPAQKQYKPVEERYKFIGA